MHELLVNHLFKFDQEKVWLGELTVPQDIAVDWDVKRQTEQNISLCFLNVYALMKVYTSSMTSK